MVDPTTANTSMSVPIRGTDVGIWDTPVNGNFNSLDAMMGGVTSVALTSAPVTLTTSQALVNVIRFTGTLTANVAVTLPGIYKSWTVDNQLVNSPSSFAVSLVSTSGTSIIGCPPGPQDVFYDGTSVKYRNLGRIGEYWDYAGSTVPSWVTVSTIPPYLNCDGTVFSSATYPILANLLGTVTRPDSRGRYRASLNQTTSRITSSGGVDGDTAYASGGIQNKSIALGSSNLPNSIPYKDPGHTHAGTYTNTGVATGPLANGSFSAFQGIPSAVTGITINPSTAAAGTDVPVFFTTLPPSYVGGITMIRAA